MKASWTRLLLASVLGVLLTGGIAGLAVVLGDSQSDAHSLLLLGAFGMAAAGVVVLLLRLLSRSDQLSRVNTALERRNVEVERATQAKSRFVASLSHELRTPLNAIIGFADLMGDGRLGPVSPDHGEYLEVISGSAGHLLGLINEVLDLAGIEAGHTRLDPSQIEPAAVATECVNSLRALASEKQVEVRLEANPLGPVMLDPGRLRQVILNYVSNAIRFAGDHGTVTVTVCRDGDELLIEVGDTGPGIAPNDQERVFEEFVQLTPGSPGGSGLGLAVTKLIVEAQGGTVGVRSEPGRGSTFHARLPLVGGGPSAGGERNRRETPLTALVAGS